MRSPSRLANSPTGATRAIEVVEKGRRKTVQLSDIRESTERGRPVRLRQPRRPSALGGLGWESASTNWNGLLCSATASLPVSTGRSSRSESSGARDESAEDVHPSCEWATHRDMSVTEEGSRS